jgi:hypothetical protein
MVEHVGVSEPSDLDATSVEGRASDLVVVDLRVDAVVRAIELDHETRGGAVEVCDVGTDRVLATYGDAEP